MNPKAWTHRPPLIDGVKMLGPQTLEPLALLSHMTKGMALAGLQVATKFLTIRFRKAQWKRWARNQGMQASFGSLDR